MLAGRKEERDAAAAWRARAAKARKEARQHAARLHDQLHLMWESVALRCVLVKSGEQIIAVQLFKNQHAVLTERCRDADEAADIAERLWDQFVESA